MEMNPGTSFTGKLLDPDNPRGVVSLAVLPYDNETDLREALANFRAYLSILREWDQDERLKTENRLGSDGQISVVDSGLR